MTLKNPPTLEADYGFLSDQAERTSFKQSILPGWKGRSSGQDGGDAYGLLI